MQGTCWAVGAEARPENDGQKSSCTRGACVLFCFPFPFVKTSSCFLKQRSSS